VKKIRLRVPASTSNIGPGFDTLGLALTLYNYVEMEEIRSGVIVHYEGEGAEGLARTPPEETLPYRAARETFQFLEYTPSGIRLSLKNNIPLGRGLGSSGVVCVGSVAGALLLAGCDLDLQLILKIALRFEKHPDNITPSLMGGFTVSSIVQDEVCFVKFPVTVPLEVVVVTPQLQLPTDQARKVLASHVSFEDAQFNLNRTALLVAAFATGNTAVLMEGVKDRLHQSARAALLPGLHEVFEEGYRTGALACFLSGAGSSIVALAQDNVNLIGQRMSEVWHTNFNIPNEWLVLRVDNEGLVKEQLVMT